MTDLLPCPFCGSNNVGLHYPYLQNDPKPFVTCQDCCADGPAKAGEAEKLWNARATVPDQPDEETEFKRGFLEGHRIGSKAAEDRLREQQEAWSDGYNRGLEVEPIERESVSRADFEQVLQAFIEIKQGHYNPTWFTNGQKAADAHLRMWINRGEVALQNALSKIEDGEPHV